MKTDMARLAQKNLDHPIITKTCIFSLFSKLTGYYSKSCTEILSIHWNNLEESVCYDPAKTVCPGKIWFTLKKISPATRNHVSALLNDTHGFRPVSQVCIIEST